MSKNLFDKLHAIRSGQKEPDDDPPKKKQKKKPRDEDDSVPFEFTKKAAAQTAAMLKDFVEKKGSPNDKPTKHQKSGHADRKEHKPNENTKNGENDSDDRVMPNGRIRPLFQVPEQAFSGERRGRGGGGQLPKGSSRPSKEDAAPAGALASITTTEQFADFGGIEQQIDEIRRIVEFPLRFPEVFQHMGADPPCGILLHGPPGCGKTKLCHAIAGELQLPFYRIAAPEIVAGVSGESEGKIRSLFANAMQTAPCVIFIDEIDAIAGKRESAQREMERRIVAQLLSCMDDLGRLWKEDKRICIVLGATNRPDALDSALRRAGRFDREICLGIPNLKGREEILRIMTSKLRLEGAVDLKSIAFRTPGFVGADLHALTKEASTIALRRIFAMFYPTPASSSTQLAPPSGQAPEGGPAPAPAIQPLPLVPPSVVQEMLPRCAITMADFDEAITKVQPSSMREGFTTIPSVTWEDVGALEDVKAELINNIAKPIKCPDIFKAMGCLSNPIGVLLYGPPGCGKTLVAKAIANESGANFISIKGPELLNKYVGETERAVRTVFARAAASSPCILFFDELDALAPKRGQEMGNQAAERVVNQLLTELDGVTARTGVYVIGASNRIDIIDPAMLRPGRLDKMLYVPLPTSETRVSILKTLGRNVPLAPGVDISKYARDERCEGFSGADLAALTREAALAAVTEHFNLMEEMQKKLEAQKATVQGGAIVSSTSTATSVPETPVKLPPPQVRLEHFETALQKVKPSVNERDRLRYERMRNLVSQNPQG